MKSEKVKIEVWSDVVCPFCYIGKRKLEHAIDALHAEDNVEVIWRSFQLDPTLAKDAAYPTIPYLAKRKGFSEDQITAMCNQLTQQGKNHNIDFDFHNSITVNTSNLHRLIHWAGKYDLSNELKEAFLKAYFTGGLDLSNHEQILSIIADKGLDRTEAEKVITTDTYSKIVEEDITRAKELGINGVPFFLINDIATISGAQPDAVFINTLKSVLHEVTTSSTQSESKVCTPDEGCE